MSFDGSGLSLQMVGTGGNGTAYLVAGGITGMDHIRNHIGSNIVLHP